MEESIVLAVIFSLSQKEKHLIFLKTIYLRFISLIQKTWGRSICIMKAIFSCKHIFATSRQSGFKDNLPSVKEGVFIEKREKKRLGFYKVFLLQKIRIDFL